ncbi:MAG: DUF3179 domain-containing protein [Candidatus Nitrosocosmicus sp.]
MNRVRKFAFATAFILIIAVVIIIIIIIKIDFLSINLQNLDSGVPSLNKSIVPLDQIVSGGPPPDGIPSIDNPKFVTVGQANSFLSDTDLILGFTIKNETRGYPLQILVWHEIVNDVVGETPIAVTYCPICFTNQIFNRTLTNGQTLEFGTSGKLYNSNLVMYDRNTNSLWSQAMAQSIAGELSGVKLERIPFDLAYWKDWKQLYPKSQVLSQETGHARPYGVDPYGNYYTNPEVLFPVANQDNRLGLKDIIIGIENEGNYKAYTLKEVESSKVISDNINDKSITLWLVAPFLVKMFDPMINGQILTFSYDSANQTFLDEQTHSEWNNNGESISGQLKGSNLSRLSFDEGFWFEWVAFHPDTKVYTKQSRLLR